MTFMTQMRVEKLVSAITGSTSGASVTISANFHYLKGSPIPTVKFKILTLVHAGQFI